MSLNYIHKKLSIFTGLHVILYIAFFLLIVSVSNASDVCAEYEFEGMHENKLRAESVLPKFTTDIAKDAKMYVEYDNGIFYYHSNFLVNGNKYPTKVKGDNNKIPRISDPSFAFANVVLAFRKSPPTQIDIDKVESIFRDNVELIIDTSIFDENGIPRIDLTNIKNFHLVDTTKTYEIPHEKPEIITTSKPPPSMIAKIKGCCLYGRPPHLVRRLSEELGTMKFNKKDFMVASLFIDKATEKIIMESPNVRSARIKGDSATLRSENDLQKLFEQSKDSALILLGHVDKNGDYVVETSSGDKQLSVPIEKVREMAKKNNVLLIDIGCETIKSIEEQQFGLGVTTEYNSVQAVKSLEIALKKSESFVDFLENFSSENLKIVVEPSFLKKPSFLKEKSLQASIYARTINSGRIFWKKIAQITISFFKKVII